MVSFMLDEDVPLFDLCMVYSMVAVSVWVVDLLLL